MVEEDKLEELIAKDQLKLVRQQERAFTELTERTPAFPPTFKFERGTSEYDLKWMIKIWKNQWKNFTNDTK